MATSLPRQPRLKPWVIPTTVILGLGIVSLILLLPILVHQISVPSLTGGSSQEAPSQPAVLRDAYREPTTVYGEPKKEEPEPPAPVTQASLTPTAVQPAPPALAVYQPRPQPSLAQIPTAVLQQTPQAAQGVPQAQVQSQASQRMQQSQQTGQGAQQKPNPHKWGIELGHAQQQTSRQISAQERDEAGRTEAAKNLIKQAIWAKPAYPKKTLYRQQAIPGVTIDEMVSTIPGQYKIRVTVPVFDRFERDVELIPKDSVVIITQKRMPGYGENRLELGVEEIQPPTPEVISLKAAVSDKAGGSGVGGDVDNHYFKLILATVISTAINVGGRVAAGNPHGYNYDVGQELVRDAGQQVSQDAKSIVDKQLRVPPTITIPANTPVSINLMENITFSRKPVVVR